MKFNLSSYLDDLRFKLRLTWKRLCCRHKYELMGGDSPFHRHICVKCNKVVLERKKY